MAAGYMPCFNRRRDACFLATIALIVGLKRVEQFQSQTRRLLPRNAMLQGYFRFPALMFQSQTRRLLPRNALPVLVLPAVHSCFNRRRDACFLATMGWDT